MLFSDFNVEAGMCIVAIVTVGAINLGWIGFLGVMSYRAILGG